MTMTFRAVRIAYAVRARWYDGLAGRVPNCSCAGIIASTVGFVDLRLDVDAFGARAFLDLLVDVVVDWLGAGAAIGGSVGRRAS
jgi:hypothetical protein